MENWQKYQLAHFPALHPLITNSKYQNPEEDQLFLPCNFPQGCACCQTLGLAELRDLEFKLREGEAIDALESVHTAIKQFGMNFGFRKKHVRGQQDNMWAHTVLNATVAERNKHVRKYQAV
jgi:hypothetical protein